MIKLTNIIKDIYDGCIEAAEYRSEYYKNNGNDMVEFLDDIKDWFIDIKHEPKELYRKPIRRIKQTWYKLERSSKWFVRTWNNPDWDFDYLIKMMVLKMKDMRYQLDVVDADFVDLRHQPKNTDDSDSEETIDVLKSLDQAIEIGERLIKNDYINETPEIKKWFSEHSIFNDRMPDDLNNEFHRIMEEAEQNEQNDRKSFFNIIRDNHEYWWS